MKKLILSLFVGITAFILVSCSAAKMEVVKEPGPSISGIIYDESGVPLENAVVSVYLSNANLFHGPDNFSSNFTRKDGIFSIKNLSDGVYFLVARKRVGGTVTGPLMAGDYNGEYENNPVKIVNGKTVKIEIVAKKIEGLMLFSPMHASKNRILIKGIVKDAAGKLLHGIYIMAYVNPTMQGRPDFISQPSNINGEFVLNVSSIGKYYLAAKQVFKKPPVIGELVGTYNGNSDHSLEIKSENGVENILIVAAPFTQKLDDKIPDQKIESVK